jgi:hypothetical protein
MGHGVEAAETFTNQLERLLARESSGRSYQLINAGVQGYATPQYVEAFRRAIRFSPDFVVVGFCMNDLTEPLVLTESRGRSVPDYHLSVRGTLRPIDFLLNDTGVGRLASWIRQYLSRDELAERWRVFGVDSASWPRAAHWARSSST